MFSAYHWTHFPPRKGLGMCLSPESFNNPQRGLGSSFRLCFCPRLRFDQLEASIRVVEQRGHLRGWWCFQWEKPKAFFWGMPFKRRRRWNARFFLKWKNGSVQRKVTRCGFQKEWGVTPWIDMNKKHGNMFRQLKCILDRKNMGGSNRNNMAGIVLL